MNSSEVRAAVLDIAALQIGNADPSEYWKECIGQVPAKHLAWCGIFALYCIRKATGCNWTWAIGSGFLFRLNRIDSPLPGDVAYFDQPFQHHALVQTYDGSCLCLIQGNYGTPGHVAESVTSKKPSFYSIQRIIDEFSP